MIKINRKISIENNLFEENVKTSFSFTELFRKCGFNYSNGKIQKVFKNLIDDLGLSIDHFDKSLELRLKTKYKKIIKKCPVCNNNFETLEEHKREKTTCSKKCANTYFSYQKHTELSNLKRHLKLYKVLKKKPLRKKDLSIQKKYSSSPIFKIKCLFCSKEFLSKKNFTKFCKNSGCVQKYHVKNGTHKGWSSRLKLKPSFPEKVTIEILDELNIKYVREFKIDKWFIDFADVDRKIALEIDGKQHNLHERKLSDESKDKYLKDNGWIVNRIKWKKITKEIREELKTNIMHMFRKINNEI